MDYGWRDGIVRACPRIVKDAYIRLLDLAQLPLPLSPRDCGGGTFVSD